MNKHESSVAETTERRAGIVRFVIVNALAVGLLAGLAEMCWSYLLPVLNAEWRILLPMTAAGLSSFALIAAAVDATAAFIGGVGLAAGALLATRLTPLSSASARLRVFLRGLILGCVGAYLYTGWTVLFVLLSEQRNTLEYRLIVLGGAALVVLAGFLASWAVAALGRRYRRITPTAVWTFTVVVLIGVLAPCVQRQCAKSVAAPVVEASPSAVRPNVLLVTLDTLRVDYLGCYGHPWIQTPNIDALAARSVIFDAAIAQAPSTAPSHCSIMTSTYPFDHEAENGKPMKGGLTTLADVMRANGYETAAFISSSTTRSVNSGLQQGFERYVDSLVRWSELFGRDEFQHLILFYFAGILDHSQIPGDVVSDRALRWLERRSDRPFFVWLHYFDPHLPYGSPPPYRGMYAGKITDEAPMADARERYAEDITCVDAQFGRVLDALKSRALFDDTMIVVAADHGEAFGERHGDVVEEAHGRYLYDTTQRVPLFIKPAEGTGGGRRVTEQVELTDIAPTVLESGQLNIPTGFRGRPLTELLEGRPYSYAGRDAHAFNVIDVIEHGRTKGDVVFVQQLAIRSPEWKFIARPKLSEEELYDLRADANERRSVLSEHADVAAARREVIRSFWDESRDTALDPRQRLAPALVRELQALGYLVEAEEEEGEESDADTPATDSED